MKTPGIQDRVISFGAGLAAIPERLLLAHARGQVLFIAGAGISRPSHLPDFRDLVLQVYEELDPAAHAAMSSIPTNACNQWPANLAGLTDQQAAEVRRYVSGDYDVVLGMLERRMDGQVTATSTVRRAISRKLHPTGIKPASTHRSLMRLADRGGVHTIATTNFDLLLEAAAKDIKPLIQSYALGGIPRPGRRKDFAGILHIHGALASHLDRISDLILSDQDFGEFYLRRRVVPDFIYDAARLFNLVLVGYSANDPPMRYLLNAVAADGTRFEDLKERFAFVSGDPPDPIAQEDWRSRGITPIPYNGINGHSALHKTLERWARLSAVNGKRSVVDAEIKRIVRLNRNTSSDGDRDLFDHFVRRGDTHERIRIAALASKYEADLGWLDAIDAVVAEPDQEWRR